LFILKFETGLFGVMPDRYGSVFVLGYNNMREAARPERTYVRTTVGQVETLYRTGTQRWAHRNDCNLQFLIGALVCQRYIIIMDKGPVNPFYFYF